MTGVGDIDPDVPPRAADMLDVKEDSGTKTAPIGSLFACGRPGATRSRQWCDGIDDRRETA